MSIRSFLCLIIGVLMVLLLIFLVPKQQLSPKGVALSAVKSKLVATNPAQVVIYHQEPVFNFKVVGQVRAEVAMSSFGEDTRDKLLGYVKQQAASLGADGIIVRVFVPDTGVQQAYTFVGVAIKTLKEDDKK